LQGSFHGTNVKVDALFRILAAPRSNMYTEPWTLSKPDDVRVLIAELETEILSVAPGPPAGFASANQPASEEDLVLQNASPPPSVLNQKSSYTIA